MEGDNRLWRRHRDDLRQPLPCAIYQLSYAGHDLLRLERLHEHAVALHLLRPCIVYGLEGSSQQEHGNVAQIGSPLHERGDVIPASLGHPDIGQNDIRPFDRNTRDGLLPVAHADHLHVLARERQLDDSLNGHAVIGEQELMSHGPPKLSPRAPWRGD